MSQFVPASSYFLPTNELERDRLNEQHKWLLNTVYDGRLISDDSIRMLAGDGWVLDAGTGSGAWLMDLVGQMPPTSNLHGIDISANLFPTDLPSNVTFTKGSVTSLPAEWTGRFEFIHQRLLILALREPEWDTAIAEYFRVLKPGGHVQFLEPYMNRDLKLTAQGRKLTEVISALFEAQGLVLEPPATILRSVEQAGFVNIRVEEKQVPVGKCEGEWGVVGRRSFSGAFRGAARAIMMHGGFGVVHSEEDIYDMMDSLEADWDNGAFNRFSYGIIWAQKPPS